MDFLNVANVTNQLSSWTAVEQIDSILKVRKYCDKEYLSAKETRLR